MKTPLEKMNVCDICGDPGVEEAILTCSRCKINCEHMYCMKVPLEEVVDDWTCEECKFFLRSEPRVPSFPCEESQSNSIKMGKGVELPSEIKKLQNESRVGSGSGNWEKRVEKGKTKYLSVQEAIQLSSGEKNSSAPIKFKWRSKSKEPNVGASVFEKTAIRRKIVPLNFSSQQDLASGSLQQPRLHKSGNMEICEKQVQLFTKPLGCNIRATNVRSGDAKKMNTVVLPDSEKPSYSPAFDALWKGSFRIQDDHKQEELNLQIKAHPPSRVRKKIYEFSKKMPEKLHFQLVCAKTFWNILFYEDNPDERNIALYFFPSDSRRSEDYICLMESFSLRDLALRKQIKDIELLVFTSKRLPLNFQSLNGKYFLWGIFHRVKNNPSACMHKGVSGFSVPPSNEPHDHVSDREEVDMDVDMIGGIEVGKFDVRVEKEPFRELTVSPPIFYGPQQQTAVPRPIYGSVNTAPLLNDKMEPCDLSVPPGFEDVYRLRKEGLSSLKVGDREGERRESDGDPSSSGKLVSK